MKLFEDMQEMGGSINDVIQKIINDMFGEDLDDDQVEEIAEKLSLSELLELDVAYTKGDNDKVADILGPLPTFEYSMGTNRTPSSAASERPAPRSAGNQQTQKKPGTQNTVNTNRDYSGGVQNGVSTTNVDQDIDGDAEMQDPDAIEESGDAERLAHHRENLKYAQEEYKAATSYKEKAYLKKQIDRYKRRIANIENNPIEEASAPDYNPAMGGYGSDPDEGFNSSEVIRGLEGAASDGVDEDPMFVSGLQQLAHRINQSYPDSVTIPDIMNLLNEPELRGLRKDDVEYALQAAGIMDMMEEPSTLQRTSIGGNLNKSIYADILLRKLAREYQGTMAGMGSRDEQAIIDDMLALADESTVEDFLSDINEQKNAKDNVVEMKEWLQRRAGIK